MKSRVFKASTMDCWKVLKSWGPLGVLVGQGSGGVGTGTISERELLFSSLSVMAPEESTIAVTGLLLFGKNRVRVSPAPSVSTSCWRPLTVTVKVPAAA